MNTVFKVVVGILIAATILIVGCVALIGVGANEVDQELDRQQGKNAITNAEARQVRLGTTRREVVRRFGKPATDQESENQGLGSDSCIYYNLEGGELLDQWQFCFQGRGQQGKLRSKNRL